MLIAGFSLAEAQDLITTRKGEDIQAKVLEVDIDAIKYKKTANPDGPVYTIPREDVLVILYANGEKDVFYDETPAYSAVQVRDGMRYKEYKHYYNKHDYIRRDDDPYSPFLAGFASYLIPGMGQCVCGEWGRGITFFLGTTITGSLALGNLLSEGHSSYYYDDQTYYYDNSNTGGMVTLVLAAGALYIWNICDAVKVAKIKNMYYQDLYGNRQQLKLHIEPYLGCSPAPAAAGTNLASGLSLKVDF